MGLRQEEDGLADAAKKFAIAKKSGSSPRAKAMGPGRPARTRDGSLLSANKAPPRASRRLPSRFLLDAQPLSNILSNGWTWLASSPAWPTFHHAPSLYHLAIIASVGRRHAPILPHTAVGPGSGSHAPSTNHAYRPCLHHSPRRPAHTHRTAPIALISAVARDASGPSQRS